MLSCLTGMLLVFGDICDDHEAHTCPWLAGDNDPGVRSIQTIFVDGVKCCRIGIPHKNRMLWTRTQMECHGWVASVA